MRVGITGAGATGKSTLLQRCRQDTFFKDYKFLGSVTRDVFKEVGVDGELAQHQRTPQQNYDLQRKILAKKHLQLLENADNQNIFSDRILLDHFAYLCTRTTESVTNSYFKTIHQMVKFDIQTYDIVFYCEPFATIETEGFRDPSKTVQHLVDAVISAYLEKARLGDTTVVYIGNDTTVDQRLDMVKQFIRMHSK